MGRMFSFITATWNPLGGECLHKCSYCWARALAERYMHKKYQGTPRLITHELTRKFAKTDFVFVCDMTDLFGHWIPSEIIQAILNYIQTSPATFLLLTKNPARYLEFKLPKNCVAGATIETDYYPTEGVSNAPHPTRRIEAMQALKHRKMVSIEPVMYYSDDFAEEIIDIHPEFVAVGYDNYNHELQEPFLCEIEEDLIPLLEKNGIKVYKKTMRERIFTKADSVLLNCEKEKVKP